MQKATLGISILSLAVSIVALVRSGASVTALEGEYGTVVAREYVLAGPNGRVQGVLGTRGDVDRGFGPGLWMYDKNGMVRATMYVEDSGRSKLETRDREGDMSFRAMGDMGSGTYTKGLRSSGLSHFEKPVTFESYILVDGNVELSGQVKKSR